MPAFLKNKWLWIGLVLIVVVIVGFVFMQNAGKAKKAEEEKAATTRVESPYAAIANGKVDVEGGELEVLDSAGGGVPEIRTLRVPTAGGRVVLQASEALLPYGELVGRAGGAGAAGGSLRVALTLENRVDNLGFEGAAIDVFPEDPRVLAFGERPLWRDTWAAFGTPEFAHGQ